MAIAKPVPVPETEIQSVDVPNFGGGLFLGGAQNAPNNSFVSSKDVELDRYGYLMPRRNLIPFLPDTVANSYQKYPVLWAGVLYYFTLDNGKAKFCLATDSSWTDCGGGSNSFTTNAGGFPKLLRSNDCILILNGKNGDKLAYIDLNTGGFPVVKYTLVTDPAAPLTGALTNLTTGPFSIYYAFSYSGAVGETALSPILTKSINIVRDQWQQQTSPASLKLSRPAGSPPTGSQFWNLYIAIAATSGTIQASDMLQLATGLDLANFDFVDDGALSFNLSSVPPDSNSTDGPRVSGGLIEDGNPILFQDEDDPYNIWIGSTNGASGPPSFSVASGGYRAEPEKGTNFYPYAIVGFRTGQGVPALTVLYSNTEGLSKQAVLQQQTVNYGDQSFTIWGVTEQHYGAAGVTASNSAVNYNGKLMFLSADGFSSAETQPSLQNVLSIKPVSSPIDDYVRGIKNAAMPTVVGTGWEGKLMWLVPNAGFDTPQQIAVLDTNNKGAEGNGAWETLDIPADWIGVISPPDDAAFVYVSQGKRTFKLLRGSSTYDTIGGVPVPFSTGANGPLLGLGGNVHNIWQATVQAVFNVMELVGDITVGIVYRNEAGRLKTKTKVYHGPVFVPSTAGGWGDPGWGWSGGPRYASEPVISDTAGALVPEDVRIKIPIDNLTNEFEWFYYTNPGYNHYRLRGVSMEGVNLGVRPDLQ